MILLSNSINLKVSIYQSPVKLSSATITREKNTISMNKILERVLISISTRPVLERADFEFISARVCRPVYIIKAHIVAELARTVLAQSVLLRPRPSALMEESESLRSARPVLLLGSSHSSWNYA